MGVMSGAIFTLNTNRFYCRHGVFAVMMAVILLLTNAVHAQQVVEQLQLAAAGILVAAIPFVFMGAVIHYFARIGVGQASSLKHAWQLSQGNGNKLALVVVIIPMLSMAPFCTVMAG